MNDPKLDEISRLYKENLLITAENESWIKANKRMCDAIIEITAENKRLRDAHEKILPLLKRAKEVLGMSRDKANSASVEMSWALVYQAVQALAPPKEEKP